MRSDRELLELAAKAAGMNIQRSRLEDPLNRDFLMNGLGERNPGQKSFPWNPLTDDGDALRLAVKLNSDHGNPGMRLSINWSPADDPYATTRRAIVCAAAEIGAEMQEG